MASDNQKLPTSHMVAVHENFGACGTSLAPAPASYTVDYYGYLFYDGTMLKTAICNVPFPDHAGKHGHIILVTPFTLARKIEGPFARRVLWHLGKKSASDA